MPIFLSVKEGHRFRDLAVLAPGKPLIIGRSPDVDVSFPQDFEMSSRHVQIEVQGNVCRIQDLGSTNGSFVNGEPVKECQLKPGDLLRCGGTDFRIEVPDTTGTGTVVANPLAGAAHDHDHGQPGATASTSPAERRPGTTTETSIPPDVLQKSGFSGETATEICRRFGLTKLISVQPEEAEAPEKFAVRLSTAGEDNDCLTFIAYALPKRLGVWWLIQCILAAESQKSDADPAMLKAAEDWVRTPTDEARRKAMQLAEELEMATPAAWAGVGAFWSHGSMGPANVPAVPPADNLAGKAISGGAILASVVNTPENAPARRKQFIDLALRIASGELTWEE